MTHSDYKQTQTSRDSSVPPDTTLEWLAPTNPDATVPFTFTRTWVNRIAALLSIYFLLIVYPVYLCLRWIWSNEVPSWQSPALAIVCALLFWRFANRTMWRLFHVAGQDAVQQEKNGPA